MQEIGSLCIITLKMSAAAYTDCLLNKMHGLSHRLYSFCLYKIVNSLVLVWVLNLIGFFLLCPMMQGRDKPFCTNISGNAEGFGFRFRSAGADCWSLWCRISFLADPGRFLFCFRWLSFGNPLCDFLHTIRGGTIRFPVAIMFIIFRYRFYNFIQCCLDVWIYNL